MPSGHGLLYVEPSLIILDTNLKLLDTLTNYSPGPAVSIDSRSLGLSI